MKAAGHLDPTSYAMLVEPSLKLFSDTAERLIAENREDDAKDVLNRAWEVLPERIHQVNVAVRYPALANGLYKVGETDKANCLLERNTRFLAEQLAYYAAIAETKPNMEGGAIRDSLVALEQWAQVAAAHGQNRQQQMAREVFERYRQRFFGA